MQWRLSEEQDAYQETLRDWLAKVADPASVRRWLDEGDATTFATRFENDGWTGVGVPEALGGQGGGLLELALTAEELARACAPSGAWLASVLAAPLAGALGDAALLIPADAVPHLAARADIDADGRVTGAVPRVLSADTVTSYVVVVGGEDAPRLCRVAAEHTVVTRRRPLDRSRSMADVALHAAPSEPLAVDAAAALLEASARAAVLVAADALGASERMLDLTVEYARQRHQFGVPIGSFQAVKHAAATMLVGIEAARSVVLFAAASVDLPADERDPQWFLQAAAAKSQVTAEAARAADSALTLHGAIGYTWEHDLQLFYKRAKLDQELAGRPAAWDQLIADGLHLA